jgi:hypothetical protein
MLADQVGAEYWQLSLDCEELALTDFFQLYELRWCADAEGFW